MNQITSQQSTICLCGTFQWQKSSTGSLLSSNAAITTFFYILLLGTHNLRISISVLTYVNYILWGRSLSQFTGRQVTVTHVIWVYITESPLEIWSGSFHWCYVRGTHLKDLINLSAAEASSKASTAATRAASLWLMTSWSAYNGSLSRIRKLFPDERIMQVMKMHFISHNKKISSLPCQVWLSLRVEKPIIL